MADNTLSEYDQNFAHAMASKLRPHREAGSRRADLIELHGKFAEGLLNKPAKITPGLR